MHVILGIRDTESS